MRNRESFSSLSGRGPLRLLRPPAGKPHVYKKGKTWHVRFLDVEAGALFDVQWVGVQVASRYAKRIHQQLTRRG